MKYAISLGVLTIALSGCGILSPGNKEFFQKKVPVFPDKDKLVEQQKVAAAFVAEKVQVAYDEGLKADVTNSVMSPLGEARAVAPPLAASLGAPMHPYNGAASNLVAALNKLDALYDARLKKLEDKLTEVEGKKIEGTGLIQMGYFSYLMLLAGIVAALWFILKLVSVFNPPVALGMQAVSAGSSLLRRGFSEVVEAGEKFKESVENSGEKMFSQAEVLDLFRTSHMQAQSRDVQTVIKTLTTNPEDPKTLVKELQQ